MHELKGHKAVMSSVGFLGMLAAATVAHAKPIESVRIDEVTFRNSLSIIQDTSAPKNANKVVYETPHWKRGRALQSPVLEQASSEVKADIIKTLLPEDATEQYPWLRGSAGPYMFYNQGPGSGGSPVPSWADVGGDTTWPTDIRPGNESNKLNITWKWTQDKGVNWSWAGSSESDATSSNKMYIALGSSGDYHSVVDVSCEYGANASSTGLTTAEYKAAVLNKIWDGFKSLRVYRSQDGSLLTYYGPGTKDASSTVAELLQDSDGHCDAWQQFFIDALKLQNVSATPVTIKPVNGILSTYSAWLKVGAVEAQGGAQPEVLFNLHTIVRSSAASPSALYDPSYGKDALGSPGISPEVEYEDKAILGTVYKKAGSLDQFYPNTAAKDLIWTN